MEKFDDMFMQMAVAASNKSHAIKRKVGAIAVKDNNVIAIGINGTPKGWVDNVCEDNSLKTFPFVLHAESNLIAKLARSTISSEGSTVYTTCAPCYECAKQLHQAGVSRVVFLNNYKDTKGLDFLRLLGVKFEKLHE